LLWSAAPWLVGNPDLTEQILLKSATPVVDTECGGSAENGSPNPRFGYGRLDVAAAVEMALQPWEVDVTVTNDHGKAVAGVAVNWIDTRTGYTYTATTDVSGTADIPLIFGGDYQLQVHGNAGTVAFDNVKLVNGGIGGADQTMHYDIVYDNQIQLYLPGIRGNP
jgi:hypothetical protein